MRRAWRVDLGERCERGRLFLADIHAGAAAAVNAEASDGGNELVWRRRGDFKGAVGGALPPTQAPSCSATRIRNAPNPEE